MNMVLYACFMRARREYLLHMVTFADDLDLLHIPAACLSSEVPILIVFRFLAHPVKAIYIEGEMLRVNSLEG
jgi:hypothetical protein